MYDIYYFTVKENVLLYLIRLKFYLKKKSKLIKYKNKG